MKTKSLAIHLAKMKVKREHDGKRAREQQRVESVLVGKHVGTKPQGFNMQNGAPGGALCSLCTWAV